MKKNPTSDAFEKVKMDALSKVPNSNDRLDIMKIKIEGETKETTSTGGASGAYEPALSFSAPKLTMFSDEAPKETKPKGGEVREDKLKGGKSDGMNMYDLAYKHVGGKKDDRYNDKIKKMMEHLSNQLQKGKKIELEHTDNEDEALEIAMDHLLEDPNYYTKLSRMEKGEFKEATGSASSGSYVGASFLAKSQSKKNWRGAAKPLYKGGKFVRVKKKCKTFPYCNQGDIKALDLWEDDKLKEAIKNVAKSKNIHENVVRAIILHEIEEQLFTK
jgi:hypothetical protein